MSNLQCTITPNPGQGRKFPLSIQSVFSGFLILGLVYPIQHTFSIFLPYLCSDLGASRGAVSAILAIQMIVRGFFDGVAGYACNRYGTRKVIRFGNIILGIAIIGSSVMPNIWGLYLTYGLLTGVGIALSGWIPAVSVIQLHNRDTIGRSTGTASLGVGLTMLFVAPLIQLVISEVGWRGALACLGFISVIGVQLVVSCFSALYKDSIPTKQSLNFLQSVNEIMSSPSFWRLVVVFFCFSSGLQLIYSHHVAYLVDVGIAPLLAATILGITGICSLPFKFMMGYISDRWGRRRAFAIGAMCLCLAAWTLSQIGRQPEWRIGLFVFAFILSISYSMIAPVYPSLANDSFGDRKNYVSAYGLLTTTSAWGAAFGVLGGGILHDLADNYTYGLSLTAIFALVALFTLLIKSGK